MNGSRPSAFDPSVHVGDEGAHHVLVKRRLLHAITSALLALVVGLAVADGVDAAIVT